MQLSACQLTGTYRTGCCPAEHTADHGEHDRPGRRGNEVIPVCKLAQAFLRGLARASRSQPVVMPRWPCLTGRFKAQGSRLRGVAPCPPAPLAARTWPSAQKPSTPTLHHTAPHQRQPQTCETKAQQSVRLVVVSQVQPHLGDTRQLQQAFTHNRPGQPLIPHSHPHPHRRGSRLQTPDQSRPDLASVVSSQVDLDYYASIVRLPSSLPHDSQQRGRAKTRAPRTAPSTATCMTSPLQSSLFTAISKHHQACRISKDTIRAAHRRSSSCCCRARFVSDNSYFLATNDKRENLLGFDLQDKCDTKLPQYVLLSLYGCETPCETCSKGLRL